MLTGSPSYRSVENILATVRAALTRLNRNPELLVRKKANDNLKHKENIFIIHGSIVRYCIVYSSLTH
jgi:hypothetical protein